MIHLDFDRYYSQEKKDACIEQIQQHYPYATFKTYFNHENFLLTKHRESDFHNAVAILESFDGTTLFVSNCNCGYSGHGPNNTVALLELLGIDTETAQDYVYTHNAIELEFDASGAIRHHKTNFFGVFESREQYLRSGQINLNAITHSNTTERKMYFIEPKAKATATFMQLLNIMEPKFFSYYLGMDNRKYLDLSVLKVRKPTIFRHYEEHPFVYVKGRLFDIICLLDPASAKSFINCTASVLNMPLPFEEVDFGKLTILIPVTIPHYSTIDKLKYLMHSLRKKEDIYFETPLEEKNKWTF